MLKYLIVNEMKAVGKNVSTKIIGKINANDYDKGGNVVQVSIETENFEKYIIGDKNKGKELLKLIDKIVKVNGYIGGEYYDGSEILYVKNYKIIE